MKLIEVLNRIPKIDKQTLLEAPAMEATEKDVCDYLMESGFTVESAYIEKVINDLKRMLEYYNRIGVRSCNIQDREYSHQLRETANPPAVLYYQGDISRLNELKIVAVIGTRDPSENGEKTSYRLGKVLSEKGYGVVNGLALGCDTYVLKGCIDSDMSYPIAVLPCGLDETYPKSNKVLADEIIQKGGCLISEYGPNTVAQKYMFVQRDRIQAGLSNGVIMVEAMRNSGTMHTINYAKKYNRYIACCKDENNTFTGNKDLLNAGVQVIESENDLKSFENHVKKNAFHQVSFFE